MTDGHELKLRHEMGDLGGRPVNTCTYTEVHGEMFSFGNCKIKEKYELKLMVTEWRGESNKLKTRLDLTGGWEMQHRNTLKITNSQK